MPSDSDTGIVVSRPAACFMRVVQSVAEEDSDDESDEPQERLAMRGNTHGCHVSASSVPGACVVHYGAQ